MTCAGCGHTEDVSVRTSPAPCVAASGPLIGSHSSQADLRSLSRAHGAVRRGGMSRQPVRGTSLWISNNKPKKKARFVEISPDSLFLLALTIVLSESVALPVA